VLWVLLVTAVPEYPGHADQLARIRREPVPCTLEPVYAGPRIPEGSKYRPGQAFEQADEQQRSMDRAAWLEELEAWERADMVRRCAEKQPPRPKCWPTSAIGAVVLEELRRQVSSDGIWWSFYAKATSEKGVGPVPAKGLVVWSADKQVTYCGTVAGFAESAGLVAPKVVKAPKPAPKVEPAPVVEIVAEVPEVVEPPVPIIAVGSCGRCHKRGELVGHGALCQPCLDTLADDVARRPVSLGGNGGPLAEYLGRLVHEPKRVFALELVAHLTEGAPAPTSDAAWAPKVDAKVRRYLKAAA
jgi:hypothetical protein